MILTLALGTVLQAQSNKEEVEFFQVVFGMEKKATVAEFMQLEGSDIFWTIYDQYEDERKALGKKRIELLSTYAENYLSLTDEKTDELIKQIKIQKSSMDKLIDKYYKQIMKSSGSKVAAQFYQIEYYILSAIRLEAMESIPFIGELD